MLLCDIGNTFFHFYRHGIIWKESPKKLSIQNEKVFYISVNPKAETYFTQSCQWINLASFFDLDTNYSGLGIDRIAVCEGVSDGVIIDAGSAITLDVMKEGKHLGGYILPGIASFIQAYQVISPALDVFPDFALEAQRLPQNTKEAIGWGSLKSILALIGSIAKEQKIYFCGGDGKFLSKFFSDCIYDSTLVFKGMQKALERYNEKNM